VYKEDDTESRPREIILLYAIVLATSFLSSGRLDVKTQNQDYVK